MSDILDWTGLEMQMQMQSMDPETPTEDGEAPHVGIHLVHLTYHPVLLVSRTYRRVCVYRPGLGLRAEARVKCTSDIRGSCHDVD